MSVDDGLIRIEGMLDLGALQDAPYVASGYAERRPGAADAWDVVIKRVLVYDPLERDVTSRLTPGLRIDLEDRLRARKERALKIAGEPEGAA